jgi:hypothetical protein
MGLNAWPYFCHYGGMFPIVYLTVLMQSYAFSGKEKDVDLLLLKAKSRARAKPCDLYDGMKTAAGFRGAMIFFSKMACG